MDRDKMRQKLGTRIQQIREAHEETQQTLAEKLGVDRQVIKTWETGTRHIKSHDLIALADHFDCTIDFLVGRSDNPSRDKNIQEICEYTGLNEMALRNIRCEALGQVSNKALSVVLGQDFETYHRLIWTITQALKFSETAQQRPHVFSASTSALTDDEAPAFFSCLNKLEGKYLEPDEVCAFYSSRAAHILQEIIDNAGKISFAAVPDMPYSEETDNGEHQEN